MKRMSDKVAKLLFILLTLTSIVLNFTTCTTDDSDDGDKKVTSSNSTSTESNSESDKNGDKESNKDDEEDKDKEKPGETIETDSLDLSDIYNTEANINPTPFTTREENLSFIFDNESLAESSIIVTREEWNALCSNYDKYSKNEIYIKCAFTFKRTNSKGSYEWKIKKAGLRLRGNTSRVRPQTSDGYTQAHFKLNFEAFLSDSEECKMASCMKGVNLKRFKDDPSYVREVYCYDLFRKNGAWTAPHAGYTRLFINIIEDKDYIIEGNDTNKTAKVTKLDYGVYCMVENIDKQYLKARTTKEGGEFTNNKGDLWKCTWKINGCNLNTYEPWQFGIESVGLSDRESTFYDYDLKAPDTEEGLQLATVKIKEFIDSLRTLDKTNSDSVKNWYESKFNMTLFIDTFAINTLLGMDDDYWRNKNNFYLYFDNSGKVYFIPYDYDNTLGTNCFSDTATRSPINWGEHAHNAPLIEKALSNAEYLAKYKTSLLTLSSSDSLFNYSKSAKRIEAWQALISPYIKSPSLQYRDTTDKIIDNVASWCSNYNKYKLLSSDKKSNYFIVKRASIEKECK